MGEPLKNLIYFDKNSLIDISGHFKPISTKSTKSISQLGNEDR